MLTPKPGSACIPSSLDEESGSISARKENGATGEIVPTLQRKRVKPYSRSFSISPMGLKRIEELEGLSESKDA